MYVPAGILVCLPRLETLKLDSVCFQSEVAFEKLISDCPMLKYLYASINITKMAKYLQTYECEEIDIFKCVVQSISLKRLELYFVDEPEDCLRINLKLKASSLEYLKLVGYIFQIHVQKYLSSLIEADFGWYLCECEGYGIGDSLMKVLHACTSAKTLTLSDDSMWALRYDAVGEDWCFSKFKRLVKLKVGSACYCDDRLHNLLQSSDSLEVMTFDQPVMLCPDGYAVWSPPEEVPRCLSKNLKTVEFTCYVGLKHEREMVGYMLEHGSAASALEIMKISCDSSRRDMKYELVQEICKFPRKSPTCKIEFSTQASP